MDKKKIGVTLSPALHDAVKMEAIRLDMYVEEAYTEAARNFLDLHQKGEAKGWSKDAIRMARLYAQAEEVHGKDSAVLEQVVNLLTTLAKGKGKK